MKKIKVIKPYYDLELKKNIAVDDELTVSDDRAAELCSKNNKAGIILAEYVTESEPDTEPDNDSESEPVKKSRKKKMEG